MGKNWEETLKLVNIFILCTATGYYACTRHKRVRTYMQSFIELYIIKTHPPAETIESQVV